MRLQVALACVVAAAALAPSRAVAWPARPATFPENRATASAGVGSAMIGDVPIAPQLSVRYEYHYDRNALRDSRRAGAFLVALTEAGNVLSFDGDSLRPIAEHVDPVPATSLGQDDGGAVLIGYRDGRILRVGGPTLSLTPVAKLPGEIAWIGYRPARSGAAGGAVVLVRQTPSSAEVHDLGSRRVHAVKDSPGTLLLDAKGRVWMGADHGEFGGWCRVLDLASGATRSAEMPGGGARDQGWWQGVYGFFEASPGEVWAYGGTAHMGLREGYLVRVDEPRALAAFHGETRSHKPKPNEPGGPITFVADDGSGRDVLVFSYSDVYRADRQLRRWRKVQTLRIRYRWGRPDAVGSYPSLRALHLADGGRTMLIATRLDGYVRVRSGKQEELALAGQLGARSVDRIANTRAGQLFIDEYLDDSAWRLEAGAWKEASFAPPFVPHLLEPVTVPPTTSWYKTKLLIGASGEVSTVNQSAMSPGTVTTAAWRDGRAVVLGRQMTDLYVHGTFVTPDDGVWNLNFGEIRRFANGWWIPVGKYPAAPPGAPGIQTGTSLRPVSLGPPWIVLAPASGQLLALTPASGPTGARLELRAIKDSAGNARKVSDAIPWAPGQLLLATDRGLAVYAPASGRLTAAAIPAPPRPVTRLCVDRKNRLWLGGDGLWFVDGKDGLRSLDALPMIAGSQVEAIADDGPDGVVVSLGERGVVRLTLAPR